MSEQTKTYTVGFERRVPEILTVEIQANSYEEAREILSKMEVPTEGEWDRRENEAQVGRYL
ncbi:MAG: hypothetical protein BGO36_08535 [Burkholderiales bacterium 68-10]|nr:MAG: hypothetical protein BGO36_08535 [Burkholderiales bacterium 68-10]